MIDKGLYCLIFVYACSFGVLISQYIFADVYHIVLTDVNGDPIYSSILAIIDQTALNQSVANIIGVEQDTIFNNPVTAAARIGWELILLGFGLYPFNLMYLMGIPVVAIAAFLFIYVILMGRGVIGLIRSI